MKMDKDEEMLEKEPTTGEAEVVEEENERPGAAGPVPPAQQEGEGGGMDVGPVDVSRAIGSREIILSGSTVVRGGGPHGDGDDESVLSPWASGWSVCSGSSSEYGTRANSCACPLCTSRRRGGYLPSTGTRPMFPSMNRPSGPGRFSFETPQAGPTFVATGPTQFRAQGFPDNLNNSHAGFYTVDTTGATAGGTGMQVNFFGNININTTILLPSPNGNIEIDMGGGVAAPLPQQQAVGQTTAPPPPASVTPRPLDVSSASLSVNVGSQTSNDK